MKKSISITINGRVQGVGFRYHAMNMAVETGIVGFVRNQPDGSVYIEVEGEENSTSLFLEWCRQGPRWATVESIEVREIESRNYSVFSVK
jgi:acylphosphatase